MDKGDKAGLYSNNEGFIIPFWEWVFRYLSYISIFYFFKALLLKKSKENSISYKTIEKWVMFNLCLSIFSSLITYFTTNKYIASFFIFYGMIRVFEVIVYQINVMLFDPYRKHIKGEKHYIKSSTRMVILLLHNYIELIFWFAMIYISINVLISASSFVSWSGFIKASAFCFINSDLSFIPNEGFVKMISVVAYFEMVGGMIMTMISLARFIGLLPAVEFKDDI